MLLGRAKNNFEISLSLQESEKMRFYYSNGFLVDKGRRQISIEILRSTVKIKASPHDSRSGALRLLEPGFRQ